MSKLWMQNGDVNRNDKLGGRTMSMIIAAMPAYNEDEHIPKLVLSAKKQHVDKVVVVDDGSEDMTAELAEALGAMVVRHEVTFSLKRKP